MCEVFIAEFQEGVVFVFTCVSSQVPQVSAVPPPLPPQLQQPPVVDPSDDLLARLSPSAASDWHAAAVAWEGAAAEQRLTEQLHRLAAPGNKTPAASVRAPKSKAASTTTPAAVAAAAGRLKLECVRRVDEIRGVHRRAKEREMAAAKVVAPLVEAAHGWHGGSTDDEDDYCRNSSSASGANLRSSFSFKNSSSNSNNSKNSRGSSGSVKSSSAQSREHEGTPLRMLFGGVTPGEPRCERDELQLKAAFGAASHSRAERADLLTNYLQVISSFFWPVITS
jgi:hypothetical protein